MRPDAGELDRRNLVAPDRKDRQTGIEIVANVTRNPSISIAFIVPLPLSMRKSDSAAIK
jgi:hypothetical protein